MRKPSIALLLLGSLTIAPASGDAAAAKSRALSELEPKIEKSMQDWARLDRPGGVILVIRDGQIVYQKGYGLANLEYRIPNRATTVFNVVALAQPVTGMALAKLNSEEKIALDDNIRKHLPELPKRPKPITVRDLLFHTSGLWDWTQVWPLAGRKMENLIRFEDVLALVQAQSKLAFAPGTEHSLSRTNYVLLAKIIERVTGQSFRDWTWENIFKPLGMTRTVFHNRHREIIEDRAYAYNYDYTDGYLKGADNLTAVGASGLFSPVEDLAKWVIHLQKTATQGDPISSKLTTPGKRSDGREVGFTYGFSVDTDDGFERFYQAGSWAGFKSAFLYYPQPKLAVLVVSNWDYRFHDPQSTAERLAALFLADQAKASEKPASPAPTEPKEHELDPRLLDQYVGHYRFRPGFVVELVKEKDHLLLKLPGGQSFRLFATSDNTFLWQMADLHLTLEKDAKGKVYQVKHQQGPTPPTTAPRIQLVKPTVAQLGAYVGVYRFAELDAVFKVALRDGTLRMTQPDAQEVSLAPEAEDCFTADSPTLPLVMFTRGHKSRVTEFTIDRDGVRNIKIKRQ